ncbi:MAG: hypothetical protein UMU04_07980, partial [Halanaerobiales bacterium]|nr:hypothetical protein [Halanaerobiales bacterium]
ELEEDKKAIADGLIEELAFIRISLVEIKDDLIENGFVDIMPQGDYEIRREDPASKSYIKLLQKYKDITKDLVKMLPKDEDIDDTKLSVMEKFANSRPD